MDDRSDGRRYQRASKAWARGRRIGTAESVKPDEVCKKLLAWDDYTADTAAARVIEVFYRPVSVAAGEHGVRRVLLGQALPHVGGVGPARYWADLAAQQLEEYFAGNRRRFTVAVDLHGLSEFCRRVLAVCSEIPFGQVRSYGWVGEAAEQGRGAARAVGQALAANPVPILVPCHRVIRSDGALGGFAAGVEWKKLLLTLEAQCVKTRGI